MTSSAKCFTLRVAELSVRLRVHDTYTSKTHNPSVNRDKPGLADPHILSFSSPSQTSYGCCWLQGFIMFLIQCLLRWCHIYTLHLTTCTVYMNVIQNDRTVFVMCEERWDPSSIISINGQCKKTLYCECQRGCLLGLIKRFLKGRGNNFFNMLSLIYSEMI